MKRVVGVRFRPCGKISYFYPGELELRQDDGVIAETGKGLEFGTVVMPPSALPDELITEEPSTLLRKADEEDIEIHAELLLKEREARGIFIEKVREHELEMKLVDVECAFDGNRIVFYFSAEGRVDFRELVKDLASQLHMRIELRQIGVRDETRMLGGMGTCGRPLCCNLYLKDFAPVTIKMAKSQNLSLNPTKISGCCGRLMCCLRNEAEVYDELSKTLPKRGTVVTTTDGFVGVAVDSNILAQTVRVLVDLDNDEKEMREYSIEQLKFTPGIKRPVRKADQRPVARSVVATAAKAEARKQAIREAEERALKDDTEGSEETRASEANGAGETSGEGRDGERGRRRRSRVRRRERSGEGAEAGQNENRRDESAAGNEGRNFGERPDRGDAAGDGTQAERPRRTRTRRRRSGDGNAENTRREGGENRSNAENRAQRGERPERGNRSRRNDRPRNDRPQTGQGAQTGRSAEGQTGRTAEGQTETANRTRRRRRRRSGGGQGGAANAGNSTNGGAS